MPASSTGTLRACWHLPGSLRRASNATAVLRALPALLVGRASLEVMTLHEVPPYNADLEGEALPAGVRQLRQVITEADALVICSPEYNYSIPGVLKNAIDWASRPSFASPLKGKPALIVTASPGVFGGVRAQAQIRDLLAATLARPVARQQVAIAAVTKARRRAHRRRDHRPTAERSAGRPAQRARARQRRS
jgi:chromate reductase